MGVAEIKNKGGRPPGDVYPFRAWRSRLGLSIMECARLLDRDERIIRSYDKQAAMPRQLKLAMLALEHLPSWRLHEASIMPFWRRQA